jgi:hypothetical protein
MLYTVIPEEAVLQGLEDLKASEEIYYRGRRLLVQPLSFRQVRIVQLISSDPTDYLDMELTPGAILNTSLNNG